MAELVDAPDLGSGFARSEGSIPFIRIFEAKFEITLDPNDQDLRLTMLVSAQVNLP
jgi:hypothetical protein